MFNCRHNESLKCENEIISMSRAWDKELKSESLTGFEPMISQTPKHPNTGRALYPLELRRTHGERGHILSSY